MFTKERGEMTRESIVQAIGLLVFAGIIAVTIAAIIYELNH